MSYTVKALNKFEYIEEGEGDILLLLHGLFGALSNFNELIEGLKGQYKIVVPVLPIYNYPTRDVSVMQLMEHVIEFLQEKGYTEPMHLLGNSLGGHVALFMSVHHPELVKTLTLTGSSGLFENTLGSTFPKRQSYEFVRRKTEYTFFDPNTANKELVDMVYDTVNDNEKCIRMVTVARSAIRHNLEGELHNIKVPTLLIWGKQDHITPPFVGEDFHKGIKNSQLYFINRCGHAPMMERPAEFNRILKQFLARF